MHSVTILGPQRLAPCIGEALVRQNIHGAVAAITAGWQEREQEDEELREEVNIPLINLRLYGRWDDICRQDQEYFHAHRERQDRLRQLRGHYQRRLSYLMAAAMDLLTDTNPSLFLEEEIVDAITGIQQLDAHHLGRVQQVNEEFQWSWSPLERDSIAKHRAEILEILRGVDATLLAGGHIAVLLNRLRLFSLETQLARMPLFAWSAGAMVLTERIVLFHDSPPQGHGHAEVFESGLGLVENMVVLPGARHRLNLLDQVRIQLLARRLAPALCVPLDEGDVFTWDAGEIHCEPAVRCLQTSGDIVSLQEC